MLQRRLWQDVTTWPSASAWAFTLLALVIYSLVALLINRRFKLFVFQRSSLSNAKLLLLAAIAVLTPSLLEESVYRGLLLPRAAEPLSLIERQSWIALSLLCYVLAHPLIAWLVWPWSRRIFYRLAFLLIVLGLGVACTVVYLFSQSLWPAVLIHWFTVVMWKAYFGGPDFNFSRG